MRGSLVGWMALASAVALGAGEVRDGAYWLDVPEGTTQTLSAEDVAAVMPEGGAQLDFYKTGAGTLVMKTNANTLAFCAYQGNIHVTNGLMRVESEYGLGTNIVGRTYVWPGGALDSAYTRVEAELGTQGGITQNEEIHVAGPGFGGYGALNESIGSHVMLSKVVLDGDATFGGPSSTPSVQVRYKYLDFGGHQLTVGQKASFGTLPARNAPAVPIVVASGRTLSFVGSGLESTETDKTIRFMDNATFQADGLSSANFFWRMEFVANGSISVWNAPSRSTTASNVWNGAVTVAGNLNVAFNKVSHPFTFNKTVSCRGTLKLTSDGTLSFGAAHHGIRRLELPSVGRKIRLPEGFVLSVQSFSANGEEMAEGDYTSADLANIVSGTVRVTPLAEIYSVSVEGSDYDVAAFSSSEATRAMVDGAGVCSFVADGSTTLDTSFTGLSALLRKAKCHFDPTDASTISYVSTSTWTSTNGLPGIWRWLDLNGSHMAFQNRTLEGESGGQGTTLSGNTGRRRFVSAYPTLQDYTVNGVTRSYVDLGELHGKTSTEERTYDNYWSENPTTAAMDTIVEDNGSLTESLLRGVEFHLVFGDAHPNPTNANRMCLFGRGNCELNPNYMPGRRGKNGELFAQRDTVTEALRDGWIWADNVRTNSAYAPDWGDVHVYTIIPTNAFMGIPSNCGHLNSIGMDSYARYGGSRHGELLTYVDVTNTAVDRARIDAYLMKKWTGRGLGAARTFAAVALTNNAVLTFCDSQYADVGNCYELDTLSGTGTLAAGARDAFRVRNLAFAFSRKDVCDALVVTAPVEFAAEGAVSISLADGVRSAKAGTYCLLSAPQATNAEALDDWTLVCGDRNVKLRRDGTSLYADVLPGGLTVILR